MTKTELKIYAKRIQSRLTTRGQKAPFTLGECKGALLKYVGDRQPTQEDIAAVVESLQAYQPQKAEQALEISIQPPKKEELGWAELEETSAVDARDLIANLDGETADKKSTALTSEDLPETTSAIESQAPNLNDGLIPTKKISEKVAEVFDNQPIEIQQQITNYAAERSFANIRELHSFLDELRSMEFNLMLQTLEDHLKRRGLMLGKLSNVLAQQSAKDEQNRQAFFNNFQNQINLFRQDMREKMSQTST